jgi:hypothetical protein
MPINIPIGKPDVALPTDPADSAPQAAAAFEAWQAGHSDAATCRAQLNELAARYPSSLTAWATLGELSLPDDVVAAYAFFRTGYHRGLDKARAAGWNGSQHLSWDQANNRGFLRCLYGLMRAATAVGETEEATRCRDFLLDLDPTNHFGLERQAS